jgi:hypothetical protein
MDKGKSNMKKTVKPAKPQASDVVVPTTFNANRKVSITFQGAFSLKEGIGKIASSMGFTRMDGAVTMPEYTPAINLLLEFAVAHEPAFRAWVASGKKSVMEITALKEVSA